MSYALSLLKHMPVISTLRYRSAVLNPDGKLTTIRARGHRSIFVRRTLSDLAVVEEIMWKNGVYNEALSMLTKCEVFIDLGANIGLCSKLVLEKFPDAEVYAYEPQPETFEVLRRNLATANCDVHQVAVWSSHSKISMTGEPQAFDRFRVTEGGTIEAWPMSHIVSIPKKRIDFLKIDVEGAEVEMFRESSWLERVDLLAIEFHGDSRKQSGFDAAIKSRGMKILSSSKHTTICARD